MPSPGDSVSAPGFNEHHPQMGATTLPDDSMGQSLIVLVCVLTAFSIATTFLRVVIRGITRILGWDDAAISMGLIFLIIHSSCEILASNAGLGLHIHEVPLPYMQPLLKWTLISQLFLMLSLCLTKCSICLFVLRIQNTRWLKWTLWALIVGFVVTELPVFIFWFFDCTPIESFWTGHLEKCYGAKYYNDLVWLQVSFSIVGDVACSVLPAVMLRNIQLKRNLKIAVCGLMMLGLVATGCSIGRAVATAQLDVADISYGIAPIQFWGSAEANLAVIGANMALSRMVWLFFKNGGKRSDVRAYEDIERRKPSEPSKPRGRKPIRTFEQVEERELNQLEREI